MPRLLRTSLNLVLILCIPTLFAAKGKCRRAPPVDTDSTEGTGDRPDVASSLQVVSVSPGAVAPATPTPISVYGAGFAEGVTVTIGGLDATGLTRADANALSMTAPGLPEGSHDVKVTNPDGTTATLRQGLRASSSVGGAGGVTCERMAMYFDLDSASLPDSAVGALTAAMPCLRTMSSTRLEGHADERGTTDYNVALGQRRAEAVQRWMTSQGIPAANLPVVSYGEERPADPSHSEAAWAKNRRVDMVSR